MTRDNGKTKIQVMDSAVVDELIKQHEAEEAKAEADKKKEKSWFKNHSQVKPDKNILWPQNPNNDNILGQVETVKYYRYV